MRLAIVNGVLLLSAISLSSARHIPTDKGSAKSRQTENYPNGNSTSSIQKTEQEIEELPDNYEKKLKNKWQLKDKVKKLEIICSEKFFSGRFCPSITNKNATLTDKPMTKAAAWDMFQKWMSALSMVYAGSE